MSQKLVDDPTIIQVRNYGMVRESEGNFPFLDTDKRKVKYMKTGTWNMRGINGKEEEIVKEMIIHKGYWL